MAKFIKRSEKGPTPFSKWPYLDVQLRATFLPYSDFKVANWVSGTVYIFKKTVKNKKGIIFKEGIKQWKSIKRIALSIMGVATSLLLLTGCVRLISNRSANQFIWSYHQAPMAEAIQMCQWPRSWFRWVTYHRSLLSSAWLSFHLKCTSRWKATLQLRKMNALMSLSTSDSSEEATTQA